MSDQNPYSTPDASLSTGNSGTYNPSLFSFGGRIGRMRYLAYNFGLNILLTIAMIPIIGISALTSGNMSAMSGISVILIGIIYIVALVVTIVYGKRRLNDLNRSGWFLLLLIIPLINLLLIIYMIFFSGTEGGNNYGPTAIPNSLGVKILGSLVIVMFSLSIIGIFAARLIPALA